MAMTSAIADQKKCADCGVGFRIDAWDRAFYQKVSVPEPRRCPECRERRRCLHINQLNLFKRRCDATGKSIVSNFPQDSKYTVYSQQHWYSDAFDATNYGRDYDFSRPFFEQYAELSLEVPRPALFTDYLRDENSAFTNYAGRNKNCYLIFDSDENRDCYYSYGMNGSLNCLDCYRVQECELCFETIDSRNCYNSIAVSNSENCSDSAFLDNCIGCSNCFFSSNLRHKQNYAFNKPVSEQQIAELKAELSSYSSYVARREEFLAYRQKFPQKFMRGFRNENSSGDYLVNCKNAVNCFDARDLWDGKYCFQTFLKCKDCMDCHEVGEGELLYQCDNLGYNAYNVRFSLNCLEQINNLTYCDYCFNGAENLFGCVGIKRRTHCILNKPYSAEEYSELVPKIISQMTEKGEWGEFFPPELSCHEYNLTIAQVLYPLSRTETIERAYRWREADHREYRPATAVLPDKLSEVTDDICKAVLSCESCRRNYRIISQELKLCRSIGVALRRNCFLCRNLRRVAQRTPRRLWSRKCGKCLAAIQSSYSPERPEAVFCEDCYLEALD